MAIVTIISDFYNPRNPKCRNCKHYIFKNGNWTSGICNSNTTKVKSKQRFDNSKACSQIEVITSDEFWGEVEKQKQINTLK